MQLATTPSLEGRRIVRYCGIVAGEAILGANVFKDMFAGIRERLDGADVPIAFRGTAIAMVTAGIMSLAFMGFAGLDKY